MKKATSNPGAAPTEEQLRAVTIKALATERAAQAGKEKAKSAKRRLKQARKAFKAAKKAAKKAQKRALKAQEQLKKFVDRAAEARKRSQAEQKAVKRRAKMTPVIIAAGAPPKPTARSSQAPSIIPEPDRPPENPAVPGVGL